jgi:hypothetical protein
MITIRTLCSHLLLLALLASRMSAQGPVVQSPEGKGLALAGNSTGHYVVGADGLARAIEVPPRASLTAFHELRDGWIAAGFEWKPDGKDLVLLRQDRAATPRRIEVPPGRFGFRAAPVPMVKNGVLIGLAWLEGDGGERNTVMAARWDGESWGLPETVSPLNERGQLAPSGAVLEDGSLLVVWAAVEGEDEEILWSLSRGGAWTPPALVHTDNDVPDVMPRVAAVGSGALVAWSQDDGSDYRLRIWRFDGASWRDSGFIGEEGSLRPSFYPASAAVGMVYEAVRPRSWVILEVDPRGRPVRRVTIDRAALERKPIVVSDASSALRLQRIVETASDHGSSSAGERAIEVVVEVLDWIELP